MDNEAYQVSTPLFRAITTGDTAAVRKLLASGADPNEAYGEDEDTVLLEAAVHGHTDMIDLLLQAGANPNTCDLHGYTALMGAVSSGCVTCVHQLLRAGAKASS